MKRILWTLCVVSLFGLSVLAETGESLGERAEKEKAQKARQTKPRASPSPKVFTNDDLRTAKGTVSVGAGESQSSTEPSKTASADGKAATKEKEKEKTEDELRAERQQALQDQVNAQAQIIANARKTIEDAQRELGDLGSYTFGGRRAALLQQVEAKQQEITQAEAAIADLQEQARHAGLSISGP